MSRWEPRSHLWRNTVNFDQSLAWVRASSGRKAVVGMVSGVAVANAVGLGALFAFGLLPGDRNQAPVVQEEVAAVVIGMDTPAAAALVNTMSTEVPDFNAPAPTATGAGTAMTFPCETKAPTNAALGMMRTFANGDNKVVVNGSVYLPGAGRWVMNDLIKQLQQCDSDRGDVRGGTEVAELGAQAYTINLPSGALTLVRRGDVILQISGPRQQADQVTTVLSQALAENMSACVDQVGADGDERRNPWLPNIPFQGKLEDVNITVPAMGLPAAPAGVTPVPPTIEIPAVNDVTLPKRPADPVWPAALPAVVTKPTVPISPGVEPTSTVVRVPVRDESGPGCGWAFTATASPEVDDASLASRRAALVASARENLLNRQQAWRPAMQSFYTQWASFQTSLTQYRQYEAEVAAVSAAWAAISKQRADYDRAMREYQAAVKKRDEFLTAQLAAQTAYDAELQACLVPPPAPTPPPVLCPPLRPAILDQLPPEVPPVPIPPADPRPPAAR